ncbi:MAG: Rpn family recombination-promoting nuclease/putative transposase [bacterium]
MKNYIYYPHDKFFKAIMNNNEEAVLFFKNILPVNIQKLVDFTTLQIKKDSYIEKELRQFYTDILYQVNLKDQLTFLYLLFEHQSTPDKLIAFRLLGYRVKIWELYLKQNGGNVLPPIIPLVLYHGKKRWTISKRFSDLIMGYREELIPYLPDFKYLLYDLSTYTDEEIKGNIKLKVFLYLFKHIFDDDLLTRLKDIFPLLKELSMEDRSGLDIL